jgi:hypothetical protein
MRHSLPLLLCGVLALGLQGCDQKGSFKGLRGDRGGGHGLRKECRADLEKYCADSQKGRARRQCLQSHRSEISAGCATALDARKGGHKRDRKDKADDSED